MEKSSFLDRVLDPPSYGYTRNGQLYVPARREIWREFFHRLSFFGSAKSWLPFWSWVCTLSFAIPLAIFFTYFFSWPLFLAGFIYSMVCLGSHGTFWLHRYSTHRAYKFKNAFVRELCRNLVIKIIPEETYVVSHHVHHRFPEKPGDPYNVHGGWLYCFLADVNHQALNKELSAKDYDQVCKLMEHTGVHLNSYAQYQKWGSVCHPLRTVGHYLVNWAFWYGVFYLLGGNALATALFGFAGVWAIGVRTFNYDGHGGGKDKLRDGIDFNKGDLSINQVWPGFVAGEWHNNHHLYPNGARSGFLPYQLDLPWLLIRSLKAVGGVHSVRDYRQDFFETYYSPYVASKRALAAESGS
jgi:fatty-acid desaturase